MKLPWVSRKKYETDMLEKECELFIQQGEVFELSVKLFDLQEQYEAIWRVANKKANKPQKRAKDGKFSK